MQSYIPLLAMPNKQLVGLSDNFTYLYMCLHKTSSAVTGLTPIASKVSGSHVVVLKPRLWAIRPCVLNWNKSHVQVQDSLVTRCSPDCIASCRITQTATGIGSQTNCCQAHLLKRGPCTAVSKAPTNEWTNPRWLHDPFLGMKGKVCLMPDRKWE